MPADVEKTSVEDIHGRRFVTTGNEHGLSTAATEFRYFVDGSVVTGAYQGGEVTVGKIVGKVTGPTTIELLFECVTTSGRLMCGRSAGTVGRNEVGLITLDFDWCWLTDDGPGGKSSYVEIAGSAQTLTPP